MHGLHLTADLHDCQCDDFWLTDGTILLECLTRAIAVAKLKAVGQLAHHFPSTPAGRGGVTAALLLAESHVCIHTWPEQGSVTLDVYVCNFGGDHSDAAKALQEALIVLFSPRHVERNVLHRGSVSRHLV
ncbi:MAG: adenosylmethionine decarboxylase [Gammaproteobacteria bacterium]